jgi:hypothetical protein
VGIETVCRQAQEENSIEYCILEKESKEKDLRRVVEHPEGLSKGFLEGKIARKASKFSICRRKEEGFISLEISVFGEAQKR